MNNEILNQSVNPVGSVQLCHPDDVVKDEHLSVEEKKALLVSWASDDRAVLGEPTLRQLHNGAIVSLASILTALTELDGAKRSRSVNLNALGYPNQRHAAILAKWRKRSSWRRWRPDDDDDPPPPAAVMSLNPAWV